MSSFSVPLTPAQAQQLAAQYGQNGTLPETSGVVLKYEADIEHSSVTFTVVKKPMLVPMSMIESHVKGLIGGLDGQVQ